MLQHICCDLLDTCTVSGRPQPSPKTGQNIILEGRKTNQRRLKIHVCFSPLYFSARTVLFRDFWQHLLKKGWILLHNSCHSGSIFLLWLGREVITL